MQKEYTGQIEQKYYSRILRMFSSTMKLHTVKTNLGFKRIEYK